MKIHDAKLIVAKEHGFESFDAYINNIICTALKKSSVQRLMNDINDWAGKTFSKEDRALSVAFHLRKEVDELIKELEVGKDLDNTSGIIGEVADCLILLLNCASACKFNSQAIIQASVIKMNKNKKRLWGFPNEEGVVEHIRCPLKGCYSDSVELVKSEISAETEDISAKIQNEYRCKRCKTTFYKEYKK